MRTFEEIHDDIRQASNTPNADTLMRLADEMRAHGTPSAQAVALSASGFAARLRGDYARSIEQFRHALDLYQELGDAAGVAKTTGDLGGVYWSTGDYPEALEHCHRALAAHEALGNLRSVANAAVTIGMVYWSTGDYPTTLEYYHRALSIHQERNDTIGVTNVTGNIGTVYQVTGDYPAALEHYKRALRLYQELGDRLGVARMTGSIGSVEGLTGNYTDALEHFRQGLAIHQEIGNRSGVALATGNIIGALLELNRTDEALQLLDEQDVAEISNPGVIAHNYANRATISEASGDLEAAQGYLEKALSVVTAAGVRGEAGEYHQRLRNLALKQNNLARYVEHNNEYTRITEEVNGKATAQRMAMMEAEKRIAAERAETEKHRALLYNTLPPSIADRVLRGEQVNDAFDSAAVIFMDMVGFTTMSSSMDPNDVVRLLSGIFTACDAIMNEHGLMKIKTIGDSYMAVAFPSEQVQGEAEQRRDIAQRAARAAHQLLHEVSPEGVRFRIGIHIGPVTAGVIGTERLQYDVWGDTVNVASRMESSSQPGHIHVSQAFAQALDPGFRRGDTVDGHPGEGRDPYHAMVADAMKLRERGETEIKGKGTMTTFWLEGQREDV